MSRRGMPVTRQIKLERHQRAVERNKERRTLSNAEQIQVLDRRLGKGVGAKKERERLSKQPTKEVKNESKNAS